MNPRSMASQNQGAIAIGVALLWVGLLGFVALVIDFGLAVVTRNQLQNITDGASLAGARQLGRIYEGLTPEAQRGYVLTSADEQAILAEMREIGRKNVAGGTSIYLNAEDIAIGKWDRKARRLTPTSVTPDAVWILARQDDQATGPSLATLVGADRFEVSAQSIAALTGIGNVMAGELDVPIGISRAWFQSGNFCNSSIQLFPTNVPESCAGWHTFFEPSSHLLSIIEGLQHDTFTSPGASAGETQFNFIGGDSLSTFTAFQALYDAKTACSASGAPCGAGPCDGICAWSTLVAIYQFPNCSAPSTSVALAGFATVTIDQVQGPPDYVISGRVACGVVQPNARGGGAHFGTQGSIPGLVQ